MPYETIKPILLDLRQAAYELDLGENALYNITREQAGRGMPCFKLGKSWIYLKPELNLWAIENLGRPLRSCGYPDLEAETAEEHRESLLKSTQEYLDLRLKEADFSDIELAACKKVLGLDYRKQFAAR